MTGQAALGDRRLRIDSSPHSKVSSTDSSPAWRNTLAFTTGLALLGFSLFPLMPPRLLSTDAEFGAGEDNPYFTDDYGFVDTLAEYGGLWSFNEGDACGGDRTTGVTTADGSNVSRRSRAMGTVRAQPLTRASRFAARFDDFRQPSDYGGPARGGDRVLAHDDSVDEIAPAHRGTHLA